MSNLWKRARMKLKPGVGRLSNKEKQMHVIQAFDKEKRLRDEVDNFFTETSFTALVRIYKATSLARRLMWTMVVLVMVSWLVVQCYWLLDKYFKYPVEVKIDLTSATQLEYPSVTICNLNPILASAVTVGGVYDNLVKFKTVDTEDSLYKQTLQNWKFDQSCDPEKFQCSNGQCVDREFVCDGRIDCANEDDENECGIRTCIPGAFRCSNGLCIPEDFKCDTIVDCTTGEDESPLYCPTNGTSSSTSMNAATTRSPTSPPPLPVTEWSTGKRKRREASDQLEMLKGQNGKNDNRFFQNVLEAWRKKKAAYGKDSHQLNFVSFVKSHVEPVLKERRGAAKRAQEISRKALLRKKRSRSSQSRSIELPDWDDILQNSTFNRWEQLVENASNEFYTERDDEYEATMMYAYVTALKDEKEVEESGHRKNDFIASCKFGGYKCSPQNFTYFHNYKYGNCFTFNTEGHNADLTTKFPGPSYGLILELFINNKEYVANLAPESGARVTIHRKGTAPFPEDQGFSIMTGRSSDIGIRQVSVKRLPPPHGVCADKGQTENYYQTNKGHQYTKLSCLKSCYQDIILEFCGCQTPVFYVRPGLTVCNMTDEYTDNCVNNLPVVQSGKYSKCDEMCPVPCSETNYEKFLSQAMWPSEAYEQFLTQRVAKSNAKYAKIRDAYKEFTRLQIYFVDLIYQEIEQQKAYESMNLISDLGGQLGLWLGLSAITLGELCSFLLSLGRSLPNACAKNQKRVADTPTHLQPATLEDLYNDTDIQDMKLGPPPEVVIPSDVNTTNNFLLSSRKI